VCECVRSEVAQIADDSLRCVFEDAEHSGVSFPIFGDPINLASTGSAFSRQAARPRPLFDKSAWLTEGPTKKGGIEPKIRVHQT
jgi:hypothetical protein